ncbi:MAG: GNAT family N-acetyltransferase [Proteobacteria bacterium]|nr:GNAT family N-acetyltransferase [Pseudomonadota bacterium]
MADAVVIRPFVETDAPAAHALFVRVNRLLAPPQMKDAFEAYIERSIAEEIGRIADYYAARQGSFWVAEDSGRLAGMFGLEATSDGEAMELRRMYVEPDLRRRGIARAMLAFAENECRRLGMKRLELSTSELQEAALGLYHACAYRLDREEIAAAASNKTVGGGIRRFYFSKAL